MSVPAKRSKSSAEVVFRRLVDDISRLYRDASRAQVKFAWETGRRIIETEQNGRARAVYGSALIPTLSIHLTQKLGHGFSTRNLWRMRSFYLAESIMPTSAELDWSHHAELNPVKDKKVRRQLEQRVLKEGLTSHELREIVRETVGGDDAPSEPVPATKFPPLKRPSGLQLGTCSKTTDLPQLRVNKSSVLSKREGDSLTVLDLGFFVSCVVARADLGSVTVMDAPAYTYGAIVERVVDGDTLKVQIDVGFGIVVHEKLRLRGINTPELGKAKGEKAKKFVAGLLPAGSAIVLQSHRTRADMFGRFVADVFYNKEAASLEEILAGGVYLNQELLDRGLAVRMSE
jgi:endonuclease YncB( thermonuclease family)